MTKPTVFIVDDDAAIRDGLTMLMESAGLNAQSFDAATAFLDACPEAPAGCVVTDLRMPVVTGLELQERMLERAIELPVIILTGFGEVSAAVRAMKHGAVDFIEKPVDPETLLETVRSALARDAQASTQRRQLSDARHLIEELTEREREVMQLVTQGAANKVIAHELGISERTVELHRSRVMKKTGSRSLADLMRLSGLAGGQATGGSSLL